MKKLSLEEVKKLQKEWYDKLKSNGFEDIESPQNGLLKVWHSHYFQNHFNVELYEAKLNYFTTAGRFLNAFTFASQLDRSIWAAHTEGKTIRAIAKALQTEGTKITKTTVHQVIVRLRMMMK